MKINTEGFFFSSIFENNKFQTLEEFIEWFNQKKKKGNFYVEQVPFTELDQWSFTDNKEKIVHSSGKFYSIEGIRVNTDFGKVPTWDQPIINQPEIGILGILTKVFDGIRYFLMQAKMEPGNINILQLSPTVQATKSNFSKVHKGKQPTYLEYFIDRSRSKILIDQLQTEQGAKFLEKRNRNMIIEVNEDIEIKEDFCWLTLSDIKKLLTMDNIINMDSRSVLSTIPLVDDIVIERFDEIKPATDGPIVINNHVFSGFRKDLFLSASKTVNTYMTKDELISWYTEQKVKYSVNLEKIPLSKLRNWTINEKEIVNSDRFFTVIGVKVRADSREVSEWTQPLIKEKHIGLLGFVAKRLEGVMHFLVQAKVEAGNRDIVELSPSVACSNIEAVMAKTLRPAFFDYFFDKNAGAIIHYDTLQSEEGGRFYQFQNRNMIIELPESLKFDIPDNFTWMTIGQITDLIKHSMFSIESRSLISSLTFY